MAETLREIIDHAEAGGDWDAVADWCEKFDWAQAEGRPTAEFYLEISAEAAAGAAEQQSEATHAQLLEALAAARGAGVSWERIGRILGITSRAAQQRYGTPTEAGKAGTP
ncbi:MAG: hypothetical protein F4110_10465 [Acidimicrobiaceae bacterium]|nr:hypothetical protein [Acidimicrobiaceae bacterium]MYI54386.1 hypothetical protein [Acidimicrobiaceae bacterium]MYJ41295.1 hypothetical protein [Acidimicrobiaceae bacterium]